MKPYDFEVWYETYFGNIPQISFEQFVEVATVESELHRPKGQCF